MLLLVGYRSTHHQPGLNLFNL